MALSKQLQARIEAVAADSRKELYGPKGYPPWGTKFVEIEEQIGEVGGALACSHNAQYCVRIEVATHAMPIRGCVT